MWLITVYQKKDFAKAVDLQMFSTNSLDTISCYALQSQPTTWLLLDITHHYMEHYIINYYDVYIPVYFCGVWWDGVKA